MFFIFPESSNTNPITSRDPRKAVSVIPKALRVMPFPSRKTMASATVSFAPEEMPST